MFTQKSQLKRKLVKTFRAGNLHLTYKSDKAVQVIMPKIHRIQIGEGRYDYVFTVPLGLNPSDVENKLWLFHAQFGENIELIRDNKTFILSVFTADIPNSLTYNYNAYDNALANKHLPILCGQGRGGYVAYDLVEHPHLLIAGTTGSGKSTQLRSVLTTLIKAKSPDDMHLYLADLKRSEFHAFKGIEHVQSVCTDIPSLERVLKYLDKELKRRGDILDQQEQTHITDLPTAERPPLIVLCIDEVVLLKKEKKLMQVVEDISSIGRALGVFLILSMQRGDAKVMDGKLKNNLTVRMGFRHTDGVNSRITGTPGAEDISRGTPGRFLLKLDRLSELQSPYLELDKARELLKPFKSVDLPVDSKLSLPMLQREPTTPQVKQDATLENLSIFGVLDNE
ncbi:DNA translocase FtsK [Alkalihalobacillus sp. LMS6]|uniref:FtsK/SpoIIIE domain-containing protein n=1 Tax=Alkalihalobacillus sp. LMS6 TaxID=2924034 RepID=UPI0020D14E2A|nr:FtsK/SpoIIIE domain-containing protein [Alkalihalobacillus sp. LMS6]UTR05435.1 DNA translocase FtsK [Alkalihalobacillus sp. LMS6]